MSQTVCSVSGTVFRLDIKSRKRTSIRCEEGGRSYLQRGIRVSAGHIGDCNEPAFMGPGSSMFLSRVALDDVMLAPHEYFDEMFVTGWEDSDLYFRLGLRGWRTVVDPQVVTWHARSLSSGGRDSFREIDSE